MYKLFLKRTKGNSLVTHGILSIPQYDFRCHTLELKEVSPEATFRAGTALNLGLYRLKYCVYGGDLWWPQLYKKAKGYGKKNLFQARLIDEAHLPSGDIAIGMPKNFYSLEFNQQLYDKFKEIMEDLFNGEQTDVFLEIFKTNKFQYIGVEQELEDGELLAQNDENVRTDFVQDEDF